MSERSAHGHPTPAFRHTIRVRYGDCDMQGVVFNAHYLAYADDAMMQWFLAALPPDSMHVAGNDAATFDFMVKKATVVWTAGTTVNESIDLDCAVSRWGNTSFDLAIRGSVEGQDRFDVTLTYVSVTPGTHRPCRVPEKVRAALGG